MDDVEIGRRREFLKDTIRKRVDFQRTDQSQGVPPPPVEKPVPEGAQLVPLPSRGQWQGLAAVALETAIARRRSRREYSDGKVRLDELSFLLWAAQGVTRTLGPGHALRTVPSAGCRHALETYLAVLRVNGLEPGLYRFLPLEHALWLERADPELGGKLMAACFAQRFVGAAAVTFVWTAVPYRMEWRYGLASHKVIALDAGHACQNLYLACEAVDCATCAVAAYDQEAMDELLGVDGEDELTVYLAPVGKRAAR
ncbi:MAG TPA: SagB/ThcOx family dehydrogenase [Thermoanaerobaculaceae bacterium]|nr:SagB/ThcOx family dehydrogenase [Thermoanaerobaculaceae bacterium]HPS76778.1 SagB/ThcOx family dehydrogenase [Thermoanaerobaculaceae bacterium]